MGYLKFKYNWVSIIFTIILFQDFQGSPGLHPHYALPLLFSASSIGPHPIPVFFNIVVAGDNESLWLRPWLCI